MEPSELVLYQLPGEGDLSYSPFVNKVRWALELKGLRFRTLVTSKSGSLSNSGRFPVLQRGDTRVHDSTEILLWLEREFPQAPLVPADRAAAGRAWMIESWADESLMALLCYERAHDPSAHQRMTRGALAALGLPKLLAPFASLRLKRSGKVRYGYLEHLGPEAVRGELLRHLDAIDGMAAAGEWLCGGQLTVADVAVAAFLHMPFIVGSPTLMALIAERRETFAWLQRFYARLGRPEALKPGEPRPSLAAPGDRAPSTAGRL